MNVELNFAPGGVPFQSDMAEVAQSATSILRALSNPSRLMILCLLAEREQTVSQIEEQLGLGQAYVSQQLARLRDESIVVAERDGRLMRYRISDSRVLRVIEGLHSAFCG